MCDMSWNYHEVEGLRALNLIAGGLVVTLLPDKGLDIDAIIHEPSGAKLLSRHEEGRRRLRSFAVSGEKSRDYIAEFQGGWQDLLPSRLAVDGRERHGFRSASLESWTIDAVERGVGGLRVLASLYLPDSGLRIEKSVTRAADAPALQLAERVVNLSDAVLELTWTQHLTLGGDLLADESRVRFPACRIHDPASGGGGRETRSFHDPRKVELHGETLDLEAAPREGRSLFLTMDRFDEGLVTLENPRLGIGVGLRWDLRSLPCLWYWAERGPMLSALGLEPSTTYLPDLDDAIRGGMARRIRIGGSISTWLELGVHTLPH